ncbi:uncharacterized protein TNCV_3383811 [Trichonephila clavipes]|uniref:Uncharacterized protein n=1 Tax=Trichonephila clavipes TaxID=2585209 RepID=A0A8X6VQJ6_TRICX|nr:uncharacterized protein TNCV_3383811 [Trichonephila clavipes]
MADYKNSEKSDLLFLPMTSQIVMVEPRRGCVPKRYLFRRTPAHTIFASLHQQICDIDSFHKPTDNRGLGLLDSNPSRSTRVKSECPPEENIQPCRCETPNHPTIVCSGITKMETINDVFEKSNDIRFKYFILENSALQYLPAYSLVSKRVLGLMIMNTTLTGLFDEVPSSSNTVEMFALNDVVIQRAIQWSMFQKLTKLKEIQLVNITIKKLGKEFINNINQGISSIFLSGNKMTSVAEGAFVNLNNLEFLSILNNDLKTLTRSMFGRPASIKYFEFM